MREQTESQTGDIRPWIQCRRERKGIQKTSVQGDQRKPVLYWSREPLGKSGQESYPNSNRSFTNFRVHKKSHKKESTILVQKIAQMCYNNMNT